MRAGHRKKEVVSTKGLSVSPWDGNGMWKASAGVHSLLPSPGSGLPSSLNSLCNLKNLILFSHGRLLRTGYEPCAIRHLDAEDEKKGESFL